MQRLMSYFCQYTKYRKYIKCNLAQTDIKTMVCPLTSFSNLLQVQTLDHR